MGLNQRTTEQFQKNVSKSKKDIWLLVESNIQKFRWTEFLTGSQINYGQFTVKNDRIHVLRRPDFLGFTTPTGRIKFTMEETDNTLRWEVSPFDGESILPIGLFLSACGIIGWTVVVFFLTPNIKVLAIVLSISWALTLIMTYLAYMLYMADLVSYGHRIVRELTEEN